MLLNGVYPYCTVRFCNLFSPLYPFPQGIRETGSMVFEQEQGTAALVLLLTLPMSHFISANCVRSK